MTPDWLRLYHTLVMYCLLHGIFVSHQACVLPQGADWDVVCSHRWGNNNGNFPAVIETGEISSDELWPKITSGKWLFHMCYISGEGVTVTSGQLFQRIIRLAPRRVPLCRKVWFNLLCTLNKPFLRCLPVLLITEEDRRYSHRDG